MRKLNIFSEVKEHVTARNVAEFYGLKVKRNGLACCPFHNDKHPSMKIDKFYYRFACGAKGDAINYVASTYGLSQYEAAKKIAEDFHIILQSEEKKDAKSRAIALEKIKKAEQEEKRILHIQKQFKDWCLKIIDNLKECLQVIMSVKQSYKNKSPNETSFSEDFVFLLQKEPIVGY